MAKGNFEFKGGGGSYFILVLWTSILTAITLGLYYPWALSAIERWKAKNTYIDNQQLVFKGSGGGIFGTYLLIIILSIITLGIYIPWGACRIQRWKTNNLYFADIGDNEYM